MSILRYHASEDNTITNAYKSEFNTKGTGSNMGQADILEVFSLYAQQKPVLDRFALLRSSFPPGDIPVREV